MLMTLSLAASIGLAQVSTAFPTALRSHIEYLSDHGIIQTPISSWPLDSASIQQGVEACIEQPQQTPAVLEQCLAVKQAFNKKSRPTLRLATGNATPLLNSYGYHEGDAHAEDQLQIGFNVHTSTLSGELHIIRTHDPTDGDDIRLDGSYIHFSAGNWQLGMGAIDRWWGPSWHSSLILSNNARPAPGLFLTRQKADAFNSKWLRWIGPWSMTTFMNQLESERVVPDALIWGMRVNFRPTILSRKGRLEIGLSRTALWAGDDRPKSLSVFTDLLLGKDNFEADDPGKATEPGNQLGGIDMRYGRPFIGTSSLHIYTQVIGEDEAGGLPSRPMALVGSGVHLPFQQGQLTLFTEFSDTALDVFKSDKIFNSAYGHSIYQTGYRYKGRSIGSQYDNDSRALSLGFRWEGGQQRFAATISQLELNRDSSTPTSNSVSTTQTESVALQLGYQKRFHAFDMAAHTLLISNLPDNRLSVEQKNTFMLSVSLPLK